MRPIYVRQIVNALSADVAEGPAFYALNRCIRDLDDIIAKERRDEIRLQRADDLELSVRSLNAMQRLGLQTVADVEGFITQSDDVVLKAGQPHGFQKKCMREVREALKNIGLLP